MFFWIPGKVMVLSVYLGMRYLTGGGVLAFHRIKMPMGSRTLVLAREGVQYDVNDLAIVEWGSPITQMLHHLLLI